MRLYLSNDEVKTIIDDLYNRVELIKKEVSEKTLANSIIEVIEESLAKREKIIRYLKGCLDDQS